MVNTNQICYLDARIFSLTIISTVFFPHSSTDLNQNCNRDLINSATAVANNPAQEVVVDKNRLESLLNRLVARTEGYSVESLEKIHSHLSHVIFLHRHEYDKSAMIAVSIGCENVLLDRLLTYYLLVCLQGLYSYVHFS